MTFYLDIYFLIDFTVDLISLYDAVMLAKVPAKLLRLCLSAAFGAAFGVLTVLCDLPRTAFLILLPIAYALTVLIAVGRQSPLRFLRVTAYFGIFELLVGGTVSLIYQQLTPFVEEAGTTVAGRPFILIAIGVLTTFGGLKLILAVLGDTELPDTVNLEITLMNRTLVTDAMVDSGNLARDPMDGTPVMLLEARAFEKLIGAPVADIAKTEAAKRFRLIPIRQGNDERMLYAVRPDAVRILSRNAKREKKENRESLRLVIAADGEEVNYGDCPALIPADAIRQITFCKR